MLAAVAVVAEQDADVAVGPERGHRVDAVAAGEREPLLGADPIERTADHDGVELVTVVLIAIVRVDREHAIAERAPAELGMPLSFSAGWAKLRPGDRGLSDLQRRADTALYEAKRGGKGQLMAEPGVSD